MFRSFQSLVQIHTRYFIFGQRKVQSYVDLFLTIKGTMSPGFCSFFVITVLIIQLVTLFHAQNVAFTAEGRYQVNFRIDTKLLVVLRGFSKTQRYNLKKLAQLFQIAIHFHPGNTY